MGVDTVIQSYVDSHCTIDVDTAVALARSGKCDVSRSTVRWQLYELVRRGKLRRLRRGVYTRPDKREFQLTVPDSLASLFHAIRTDLPYIAICTWSSDVLHDLTHHYPHRTVFIIEVEKEGETAVQDLLIGMEQPAVTYEDLPAVERSTLGQEYIVIKRIVSEAPVTSVNGVTVPRLEKILVDIVRDKNLFGFLEGAETHHIYESAMKRFHVQLDTLLRYASRRGATDDVEMLIRQISGSEAE